MRKWKECIDNKILLLRERDIYLIEKVSEKLLQNQTTKLQEQLTIQNNAVSAQLKTHETQLVGNINSLKSTIKGEVENDLLEILSVIQKQNDSKWTKTITILEGRIQALQNQLNEKDAERAKLLSVIQKQNENNWTKTIAIYLNIIQALQNQLNDKDAELAKLKKQDACTKPLR